MRLQIWVLDLCHFDLLKRGCANSVVGLELAGANSVYFLCVMSLGDKRAVSYKGGFGECTLVAVFVAGEHANVASFRGNIRMYPRSGFSFRNDPRTHDPPRSVMTHKHMTPPM